MMILKVLFAIGCAWIFIYTVSYGIWEMRQSNRMGGVFVFLLCLCELAVSVYTMVNYL